MNPNQYLKERETVLCRERIQTTDSTETLVCTDARLVHFTDSSITDIALDSVNVIEFEDGSFPVTNLLVGALAVLFGLVFVAGDSDIIGLARINPQAPLVVGLLFAALGIGALVEGYLKTRSDLVIHTPTESFAFSSKGNLEQFAHAVRGATA